MILCEALWVCLVYEKCCINKVALPCLPLALSLNLSPLFRSRQHNSSKHLGEIFFEGKMRKIKRPATTKNTGNTRHATHIDDTFMKNKRVNSHQKPCLWVHLSSLQQEHDTASPLVTIATDLVLSRVTLNICADTLNTYFPVHLFLLFSLSLSLSLIYFTSLPVTSSIFLPLALSLSPSLYLSLPLALSMSSSFLTCSILSRPSFVPLAPFTFVGLAPALAWGK